MDSLIIVLVVIGGLVVLPLFWFIGTMNGLKRLEVKVEESESGIDVALTKRFDVLTKLVATTKGYAKHEAETFENVTKWRQGLPKKLSLEVCLFKDGISPSTLSNMPSSKAFSHLAE